jgi:hypothetical protein
MKTFKVLGITVHADLCSLYHLFSFDRMTKQDEGLGENESCGHWLL